MLRNIVLTGFMGTGKTTVGRLLAQRLDWAFVDSDNEIVRQAGCSIPQIFASQGEAGFRRLESEVCRELANRTACVIATGGGMLIDAQNRAVMQQTGLVVCLTAPPDEILARLADTPGFAERPLLKGDWRALYAQRLPVYALIPQQVNTSGKTPQQLAEEIETLWRV